jgi:hypothetical protein
VGGASPAPGASVAVAALEPGHAAARAHVQVVDPALPQLGAAAHVVAVEGVAAVDHDVARLEQRRQLREHAVHHTGRHHHPHGARLRERTHQFLERRRTAGSRMHDLRDRLGMRVVTHAGMPAPGEAPHHVRAHAPESDHAHLHAWKLLARAARGKTVRRRSA